MNGLQTFSGFRGTGAMVQIKGPTGSVIKFAILARNPKQLEILWQSILQAAGPFDPSLATKAVMVSASVLPAGPSHQDALDRLNSQLQREANAERSKGVAEHFADPDRAASLQHP